MTQSTGGNQRANRTRLMLWCIVLIAAGAMLLPLSGYLWSAASLHAQDSAAQNPKDRHAGVNPRSEYWREVRRSEHGYTAVRGQETNVLIQSRGESWREARNGPVKILGALMVLGVIGALFVYQLITGGSKLEHRTGRMILRWTFSDRVLHWYTAVLFILLAITGLSLLWGRNVLIPLLGKEGFAAWAGVAKPLHDYTALAFTAGLIVMVLKWFKNSLPAAYDWQWIKQVGGYLDGSHPPAGFINAGEKMYYWTLVFAGTVLVASGFYLLFPNLGFERAAMQNANVAHGVSALILVTFVCLHIYLGTLGSEGAFEGMITGEVDEGWVHQHHSVWLEELQRGEGHVAPTGPPAETIVTRSPAAT